MSTTPICINGVYKYGEGTDAERTERLLWVDQCNAFAVLIEVFGRKSKEHVVPYSVFFDDVTHNTAKKIEEPFKYLMLTDDAYSPAQLLERNEHIAAMKVFITADPKVRFDPHERAKLFQQITSRKKVLTPEEIEQLADPVVVRLLMEREEYAKKYKNKYKKKGVKTGTRENKCTRNPLYLNKGTLYKLYRRFLQRGQVPNALMSNRDKAGWFTENRSSHIPTDKLGRSWAAGTPQEQRSGLVLTPEIKETLFNIAVMFHESPVNGVKLTWPAAYRMGVQAFFSRGWKPDNGVLIPDMPPANELPTLDQLKREYYKRKYYGDTLAQREGERAFNLRYRARNEHQR